MFGEGRVGICDYGLAWTRCWKWKSNLIVRYLIGKTGYNGTSKPGDCALSLSMVNAHANTGCYLDYTFILT